MQTLAGKVALVTGAGHPQGIGAAIARALRAAGASVVVTDIAANEDYLQRLQQELTPGDGGALAHTLDVTECAQAVAATQAAVDTFGRLDILVNNAGVGIGSAAFLDNDAAIWSTSFDVNVTGVVHCCQAAIPHMRARQEGSIVNVASLAGLRHVPSMPAPYTASKFAVVGLTKALASEFGPENIRCNAVCPGSVATQMRDRAMELLGAEDAASRAAAEAEENAMIALGRPAEPEEIAQGVVYLASSAARYVTGVALPMDGGWTVGL